MSKLPRSSGVLLHPTSLPGPYGIGDIGPEAYRWIDTLEAAKQHWWQILPLGPTGYGNSPYQAFSAFAGDITLLSPDLMIRDGLLPSDIGFGHQFRADVVDYDQVRSFKLHIVRKAYGQMQDATSAQRQAFDDYCHREQHWLHDYAVFMAARAAFARVPLSQWPTAIRTREPAALQALEQELAGEIQILKFGQYLFDQQWNALRSYANSKNVKLIGDAPIFVAQDSADVWANPGEFLLDEHGLPTAVAGVPPDYFSEDGQLWGNPLYDWDAMERTGFGWWLARIHRQLEQVDLIRLDHFRGFAAAWHVPVGQTTARNGTWVPGPGAKLFHALLGKLETLPFIAEDLGFITPDVNDLRTYFDLPGMRVLQFTLGEPSNIYWPHNYDINTVVYTGTHDNNTTVGWWGGLKSDDRTQLMHYIGKEISEPHWDVLRLAWASVAAIAIVPLQDWIGLGREARMNTPGIAEGNWAWRFQPDEFRDGLIQTLAEMTVRYSRDVPA